MILVIYAHPYPSRSRASAAMLEAVRSTPGIEIRAIYDLYPDFDIDIVAEQAAMDRARLVIWLHPTYWYSPPGLMKHWFDQVLAKGWAYSGGTALAGKECLWVTTTGGDRNDYSAGGAHGRPFSAFIPGVEQTARFCGMKWLEPFIVEGVDEVTDNGLRDAGNELRERLEAWVRAQPKEAT
jgi:glutathione-regulated potassium-efflux system ancillary protein KefF